MGGSTGEVGVNSSLEIIRKELDLTTAFCGVTDVRKVDTKFLLPDSF